MTGHYHKLWLQCVYLVLVCWLNYSYLFCCSVLLLQQGLTDEGVYPAMAQTIAECVSVDREEFC